MSQVYGIILLLDATVKQSSEFARGLEDGLPLADVDTISGIPWKFLQGAYQAFIWTLGAVSRKGRLDTGKPALNKRDCESTHSMRDLDMFHKHDHLFL
jgi:hypothetical protein